MLSHARRLVPSSRNRSVFVIETLNAQRVAVGCSVWLGPSVSIRQCVIKCPRADRADKRSKVSERVFI
jgi:hypothetical protein